MLGLNVKVSTKYKRLQICIVNRNDTMKDSFLAVVLVISTLGSDWPRHGFEF